jgi:hypothetical protein
MTYIPKGVAAREIHEVFGDLSTAQHQWNTYAERLGQAYTQAYLEHERALGNAAEKLKASSEAMYFVLSLYCVAFAGGLAGGLMAPWVGKAGENTASVILRTTISETAQSMTGGVLQRGIDATKSSGGSAFSPASTNPLLYYQKMKDEIGTCFSIIRDKLEDTVKLADDPSKPLPPGMDELGWGKRVREIFSAIPIIKDYPRTNNLPNVKEAERQAELGMWIAWANIRDISYWNTRMDALSDGLEWGHRKEGLYAQEARQLSSVLDRLAILGEGPRASLTFTKGMGGRLKETILNIPKLAMLGKHLGGTFFGKIDELVRNPLFARAATLPNLTLLPPIYKR